MKSSQFPISIYIHWPYCLSKCPYCDFASVPTHQIQEALLRTGYFRDLQALVPPKRPITSVFLGGGTPSLMSPQLLSDILESLAKTNPFESNCEITLEANPDAIDRSKMKAFCQAGVNRLSLGVQSLKEKDLSFLGRRHTVQTALTRIDEARQVFSNVNIDLIYARPNQTPQEWEAELTQALSLNLPHYSLYQLTIEENTVFGRQGIRPVDDVLGQKLYLLTDDLMNAAGKPAYEVSNYAQPGYESKHNMGYWTGRDYIGIGPAAHGRNGLEATANPPTVSDWLSQGTQQATLSKKEREIEKLMMGLRLRGDHWYPVQGLNPQGLQKSLSAGWIEQQNKSIRPTQTGTLMLNQLILALMPD